MKKILSAIFCAIALVSCGSAAFSKGVKQTKTKPVETVAVTHDAQYYLNLGKDYEWKNNKLGAIGIYTKALQIDPDFDEARESRAKLLFFNGRYAQALEDFNYFYNKLPKYGPSAFYEMRIQSKLQLGMIEEAFDDMYEVILVYGGQAKVLDQMFALTQKYPELQYRLCPAAHSDLISKYRAKAKLLNDYAETFRDEKYGMRNMQYYKFFQDIAKAMYAVMNGREVMEVSPYRYSPSEGESIEVTY